MPTGCASTLLGLLCLQKMALSLLTDKGLRRQTLLPFCQCRGQLLTLLRGLRHVLPHTGMLGKLATPQRQIFPQPRQLWLGLLLGLPLLPLLPRLRLLPAQEG